jgi:hypothetical protein
VSKRNGKKKGSYSRKRKHLAADKYGEFRNGVQVSADLIAGTRVTASDALRAMPGYKP